MKKQRIIPCLNNQVREPASNRLEQFNYKARRTQKGGARTNDTDRLPPSIEAETTETATPHDWAGQVTHQLIIIWPLQNAGFGC